MHQTTSRGNIVEQLFRITSRYEYDDWLKVIFGVYNIKFTGLELVHKWSALDGVYMYDDSFVDNEWKWLNKKSNTFP